MDEREYARIINQQQRLPAQLARARARVCQLERQAVRLGMKELLTNPEHVDKAWDRAIDDARAAVGAGDPA